MRSFIVRLFEVSIELIIIILPLHCEHENQSFFFKLMHQLMIARYKTICFENTTFTEKWF